MPKLYTKASTWDNTLCLITKYMKLRKSFTQFFKR